jgi:hypothetical protein
MKNKQITSLDLSNCRIEDAEVMDSFLQKLGKDS